MNPWEAYKKEKGWENDAKSTASSNATKDKQKPMTPWEAYKKEKGWSGTTKRSAESKENPWWGNGVRLADKQDSAWQTDTHKEASETAQERNRLYTDYESLYQQGNVDLSGAWADLETNKEKAAVFSTDLKELEWKLNQLNSQIGMLEAAAPQEHNAYLQMFKDGNHAPSAQSVQSFADMLEYFRQERVRLSSQKEKLSAQSDEMAKALAAEEEKLRYIYGRLFYDEKNDKNADAAVEQGRKRYEEAWDNYEAYISNDRRYNVALALSDEGGNDVLNDIRREARREYPLAVMVEALSEEDQSTFFYLVGKGQDGLALQFANDCMAEERKATQDEIRKWAGSNLGTQFLATAASVALLPYSWSDPMLAENSTALTGLEYGGVGFGGMKDQLRSGVSEAWNDAVGTLPKDIPIVGGKGFGDLYQLGMSGVDSYVSGLAFGSSGASAILGSAAMSSAYNDAIDKGATPEVALQQGMAQGIAEALFEKLSLGAFLDGKITGGTIKQILAQGGIEASEELCTSVANHFTDIMIMGDLSEYELAKAEYIKSGKSEDEAEKLATKDFYESLAVDALGGFLIGGTMSGVQSASNLQSAKKEASIFAEFLVNNPDIEAYEKYAQLAGVNGEDTVTSAREKFEAWAIEQYKQGTNSSQQMENISNAALENEQESTAVDDNPATHTAQEMQVIEEYKNSTDDGLRNLFFSVVDANAENFSRQNISAVSDRQAEDASKLLGGDYFGYTNAINSNGARHIMKEHGPNGTVDQSLGDLDDASRIGYVLNNYDAVDVVTYESGDFDTSAEFRNANNEPAPMLRYSKKVNGTYYVVEAVPESQYKKFWVVSAYMKNADGFTQARNAQSPASTPEASLASQPSANESIAQPGGSVNTEESAIYDEWVQQFDAPQTKNKTAEPSEDFGGIENAEVFDDGSQRYAGVGAGGQTGAMAQSAGRSVARSEAVTQKAVIRDLKKAAAAQSARSIGVQNGGDNATLYILRDSDVAQSKQWQDIKADAEADGAKVVLFAGDLQIYNPATKQYSKVEGIHQTDEYGNTTYYIKADKLSRNAQQIYSHEKFHEIVSANPGILGDLVRALEARYGRQEIASLINSYVEAYDGIYGRFDESMTADEVDALEMQYLEEVFADVYAGIRRGSANTARAKQIMESQTTELQRAAQNRKAMQNKNAPPEQRFSRLTEEDLDSYLNAGNRKNKWKMEAMSNGEKVLLTTEDEVTAYIEDAIEGNRKTTVAYARVSDRLADDVLIASDGDIDIRNYFMELVADDLYHAYDGHQKAKQPGDIDLSKEQFLELPQTLDYYDEIIYARKFASGQTRIVVSKNVPNGRAIIVEVVSRSHGAVHFKNMYGVTEEKYQAEFGEDIEKQKKRRSKANTRGVGNQPNISLRDAASSKGSVPQESTTVKQDFSVDEDTVLLENRVSGDDYLNAMDLIEEIKEVGAEVDAYSYVTVYHRTNAAAANTIRKTGEMQAKEDGLFFSTSRDGVNNSGYGDVIITLKVPAEKLVLDDIFEDEASVKIPLENRRRMNVSQYLVREQQEGGEQNFSFDDDVAELDEQFGQRMAEDDTPEGLAPDDEQIKDYHALAKAEKERRAKNATANALKNRIKASEKSIDAHREAKNALKNIGGLTKETAAQIDEKVKLIRETLQIDRAALQQKRVVEEKYKKKERKEKEQAMIQEQKAKTAQKELRMDLLNLFSVQPGVRFEIAQRIDQFSDELIRSGRLTNESRKELFDLLYEHGEELVEADGYYGDIRSEVQQGRIYVSESVRAEFGDDWESFRKRAWGNRIYLTNNQNDMGIDSWTETLVLAFGGAFDPEADLKTQLETIVELAQEGRDEKVTIAEMMQRNKDNYGWSVEDQMDELERKVDQMLETFAQKADLEIRLRKESVQKLLNDHAHFKKKMKRAQEKRMEAEARNQVLKRLRRLEGMLKKASPMQKNEIKKTLRDIDTLSRQFSARGIENLQLWAQLYYEQKHALGGDFLKNDYVEERIDRLGKLHLDDLKIEDVIELGKVAMGLLNTIRENGLQQQSERKIELIRRSMKAKQEIVAAKGNKDGKMRKFSINHLDAKRFFGQISGWVRGEVETLGENLSKGQERVQHYQFGAMRIFEEFLAKKENQKWLKIATGKHAVWETIEVNGCKETVDGKEKNVSSIEITPMMRVSLLMHSENEDNLWHIGHVTALEDGTAKIEGGLTIPDKKYYKKGEMGNALARGRIIKMPPSAVKQIVKNCSQEERAFAELLKKYFDSYAKAAINEVSLKMDGFERAVMEHYFPLMSDKAFVVGNSGLMESDMSLTSFGWLKERTHDATNPVYLLDAVEVLMKNIEQVSRYYGYALVMRDFDALMNATYYKADRKKPFSREEINFGRNKREEGWGLLEGLEHESLKKTIEKKWGTSALEYINKLKKDIINPEQKTDIFSNLMVKIRGNYARAVISANLSSLLKQTTSYPVALPYLKAGGLVRGLKKLGKADLKTLEKYSSVYWYRNLGNSTMELSDALQRQSFGDKLPWVFNATQKMDSFTTRRILSACEYRIREDMKLKPGTQEEIDAGTDRYWMEVAKLFNEVVLKTQSNSTIMEKPQITRANSGNISKFFTMFRTDSFQQYNMLVEAKGRMAAAKRAYKADASKENKNALVEARKFTARTMIGTLTGQMGCTLVAMLLKMLRFDDDEFRDESGKLDWRKVALYFGTGIVEGYCGFIVGGELLYSAAEMAINKFVDGDAQWWDIEPTGLSVINDGIESVINLADALLDGDLWEGKKSIRKTALALSKALGIPTENLEKYLLMTVRWFAPEWAELHQNFWTEITKENLSAESRKTIDEAIGVLMDNRTQNMSDEHKQEIARLYIAGGTGAVPTGIPSSVEYTDENGEKIKITLSGKQRDEYRKVWRDTISESIGELISSDEYEKADDEGRAELLDKLYKYASQIAQNAVAPEKEIDKWVLQGQNAVNDGIPLEEYICFRVGLSDITGKGADNKTVDGLKAQRCMEYLETMGWSDAQEKNIYLNVLASESKKEDTDGLLAAGLTWNQTNDIVSILGNKKWEHMDAIIKTNASEAVKAKALEVYASEEEKKLIRTGYKYGIKLEWYAEVRNNADKNGNGSISQEEAEEYINGMGLDWETSAYLWQMITDGKEGKKNPFGSTFGSLFWYDAHADDPVEDEDGSDSIFEIDSDSIFG